MSAALLGSAAQVVGAWATIVSTFQTAFGGIRSVVAEYLPEIDSAITASEGEGETLAGEVMGAAASEIGEGSAALSVAEARLEGASGELADTI
jgi:hypothetical protein